MLATSRESLASLRAALESRGQSPDLAAASADLLAVASLLQREGSLRATLADSGQPIERRRSLVGGLLADRVSATALDLVTQAAALRWSGPADLVDALESLGAQAAFTVAQADGSLDDVEDELFRFGRAVDASADLQMTLTSPSLADSEKVAIVRRLLEGRTTAVTRQVLEHVVVHLRGRRLDAAITGMVDLAAAQRRRVVAEVRVAAPLSAAQHDRLVASLSRMTGREVRANVIVDPAVLGGAAVRIGDDLIDGTVASRLAQARTALMPD